MLRNAATCGFLVAGLLVIASCCNPVDYKGPPTITPRLDLAPEATGHYRALMIGKWYLEQPRSDGEPEAVSPEDPNAYLACRVLKLTEEEFE